MSLLKRNLPGNGKTFVWANGQVKEGNMEVDTPFVTPFAPPAIWEGIRSYKCADGITRILCLTAHIDRLLDSGKIIGMNLPFSKSELIEGCKAVVTANGGGDLYLRPVAYYEHAAGSPQFQADYPVKIDISVIPIQRTLDKKGLRLGISNSIRGYPQYEMQAKATCNYEHTLATLIERKNRSLDDMLLMDNQGYLVEATAANLFIIKNGVILTPPNDGSILLGITRQNISVLFNYPEFRAKGIASIPGFPYVFAEKRLTRADVYTADEVFLTSTALEIIPVLEVENRQIGNGKVGDFSRFLMAEYDSIVRSKRRIPGITMEKA